MSSAALSCIPDMTWVFIVFPIIGGVIGGLVYRHALEVPASRQDKVEGPAETAA